MVFTSNKNPALWREDFDEDTTLLCALDRIFDDATVFKLRGESFRGKKLERSQCRPAKLRLLSRWQRRNKQFANLGCWQSKKSLIGSQFSDKKWFVTPGKIWLGTPDANIYLCITIHYSVNNSNSCRHSKEYHHCYLLKSNKRLPAGIFFKKRTVQMDSPLFACIGLTKAPPGYAGGEKELIVRNEVDKKKSPS